MNYEVRITQAAWADAEAIYTWIVEQGAPAAAQRWFNAWIKRLENLSAFPDGRAHAPENGSIQDVEIYQQLFGTFRSLYVVRGKQVFIVHVRRGSRQPATREELLRGLQEVVEE